MTLLSNTIWLTFLRQDYNACVLDIRNPNERGNQYFHNAMMIEDVSMNSLKLALSKLDKQVNFYLFCKNGHRSKIAMETMHSLGFENIFKLEGGLSSSNFVLQRLLV